jgi:hypothetical protein
MPAVENLLGSRGAETDGFGVAASPIAADDLKGWKLLEECSHFLLIAACIIYRL